MSLWGETAENVAKYVGKGSTISVRGRIAPRIMEFPGEQTFRTIRIVGENVSFIQLNAPDLKQDVHNNEWAEASADGFRFSR